MKRVKVLYKNYLQHLNRIDDIPLGECKLEEITKKDHQLLSQLLAKSLKSNRILIITYFLLICILLTILIVLIFLCIDSSGKLPYILGGTCLSAIAVLERLKKLWQEKILIDMTLTLSKELSPKETVRAIEALYWGNFMKK